MSNDATEDEQIEAVAVLVRRCAYREALEAAAELLGGRLGQLCMAALGEQREAAEAAEEALLELYDAMPTLDDRALWPLLVERARAICARRLGERGEEAQRAALSLTPPDTRRLPGAAAEAQREARRLRAAMAELGADERDAVLLRYTAGLDYGRIAELQRADATTVKKRIAKALLGTRKALQEARA